MLARGLACSFVLAGAHWAQQARASEGGVSFYPLGIGVPDAAIMPPLEGLYSANLVYYYQGSASASREFEIGGKVVAGANATVFADFTFVEWVASTNVAGGTFALGAAVVPGQVGVTANAVIIDPSGGATGVSAKDSNLVMGDPIATAELGWTWGEGHHLAVIQWLNAPIGDYLDNHLANLAFHAWIGDTSLAYTWQKKDAPWQVSAKAGYTFNGTNQFTDYQSGIASHYEASVERIFSPKVSVGAQAYYYWQLTGDGGSGDRIGPFMGRVLGLGGTAAYNFTFAGRPSTFRIRGMAETDAKNRFEGHSIWAQWTFPFVMKAPPKPPAAGAPPHGW
jgi:hypothetical protein